MLLLFFLRGKIHFITLPQLRMTRNYSLSSTLEKIKGKEKENVLRKKFMLLLCVFSSITALSLRLSLGTFLVFLQSGSIVSLNVLIKKVLIKKKER